MSSPTMENNMEMKMAAMGRSMDKSIHHAALAKKRLSHRPYGIMIVVCIVIICTYLTLIYVKPNTEAARGGMATLVCFMWLVPSVMFYLYINKKCGTSNEPPVSSQMNLPVSINEATDTHLYSIDAPTDTHLDSIDATTDTHLYSIDAATEPVSTTDDVFSIDTPSHPSLAFNQDMLSARREGLKKAPEPVQKPMTMIDQLKQPIQLKPSPPKKPFESAPTMWSQEVANGVNKRNERVENNMMGFEDMSA